MRKPSPLQYGGDITRKKKLLSKQKEGKKRMRRIGNVDIPNDAFAGLLSTKGSERSAERESGKNIKG